MSEVVDRFGRRRILRDDEIISDGETLRVSLRMMDGVQRAVYDSTLASRVADVRVVDAREEAYRLCVLDDTNAWRRTAVSGGYPLSAGEGRACTVDGRPGHLVPADDGEPWLICRPDARDALPTRRSDAMPFARSGVCSSDARFVDERERAYREVEERDATAWMRPITSGISK
jgi:hypothetical protein